MNLQDIKILIDGYNLELLQGTGIKTYGITLIQALQKLNNQPTILSSQFQRKSLKNKILNEVILLDKKNPIQLNFFRQLLLTYSGIKQGKYINFEGKVIPEVKDVLVKYVLEKKIDLLNYSQCYELANLLFQKSKYELKLNLKNIDIWHTTYPLPIQIKGAKKVTTIHDLIPLKLPYTTLDDKKFFYNLVKKSLDRSDLIFTVSEHTKQDILSFYDGCDPKKIVVTYQSVDQEFTEEIQENILEKYLYKYQLQKQKYILFVGAIEPKKNIGRLIEAYAMIKSRLPLVIVGKKAWLWENEIGKVDALFAKKSSSKVKILDYVPADDLKYLYQGAYCFVFPSLYEGFGLPVLEAMTRGCPVITSNTSSLPEVGKDAVLYVDPYDIDDISIKLEQLLQDTSLHSELSYLGKERATYFNMNNYMERIKEGYKMIL